MAILNVTTSVVGLSGITPAIVYILTDDDNAAISAAGYLNGAVQDGFSFSNYNMALVYGSDLVGGYPGCAYYAIQVNGADTSLTQVLASIAYPIPIDHGGTGVTSVTSVPTSSAWSGWDPNNNFSANNLIEGYASTASAGATTTLTVSSPFLQFFTGTANQTLVLPVANTLVLGQQFFIVNSATGTLTVESSGGHTIQAMAEGTQLMLTCILASGTSAASWYAQYSASAEGVLSVSGTANVITSTGGTTPVISISAAYVGQTSITTLGTIGTGVWEGTLVGIPYGGTGVTAPTTAPTAGAYIGWDASLNISTNNLVSGYSSVATAAATTTLTVASPYLNYFTGTTTQTVLLPVVSTLALGMQYYIVNNSTGVVTVQSSGANTLQAMGPSTQLLVTCILLSGSTAASWDVEYSSLTEGVQSVSGTMNEITSSGGNNPIIAIANSYAGQSSITTLGTIGTGIWEGSTVGPTYGGTGINNGTNTLTVNANSTINQNVSTTASPTFAGVTVTGLTASEAVVSNGAMQLASLPYSTTPGASTLMQWDPNINAAANNFIGGYATTATAAATTTLTVASAYQQYFTGTTTQTVVMPVTSTLTLGQAYLIVNNSTGTVTVESSGANVIQAMAAGTNMVVTCILTSGTTAASWNIEYSADTEGVQSVVGTPGFISAAGTTNVTLSISNAYAGQASITTLGTIGTGVWEGSVVGPTYGGTGINNGANTLTVNANSTINQDVSTTASPVFAAVTVSSLSGSEAVVTNGMGELESLAYASAPAASTLMQWDANVNASAANFIEGYTSTVTSAATTTLTVGSTYQQYFTGTMSQIVTLPLTSTLVLGQSYLITNLSSGPVTVQSSGANPLQPMQANTTLLATCILTSGTSAASWNWVYNTQTEAVQSVSGTTNVITSTGGFNPVINISASYVGQTSITTLGSISSGTWGGTTVAVAHGGTGLTTLPSLTASTYAAWDANANLRANALIRGFTQSTTAGATTALTNASTQIQEFIGTAAQTVTLPDVTTLLPGYQYYISNYATNNVTVQSFGNNTIKALAIQYTGIFTCISATDNSAAGWIVMQSGATLNSGVVSLGTTNELAYYIGGGTTVSGLATADSGTLVTSSAGLPSIAGPFANGQLLIGSTGATPVIATVGSTGGISITAGAGSLSIGNTAPGIVWNNETTATNMVPNNAYIANSLGLGVLAFLLPTTAAIGSTLALVGNSVGGWTIVQNSGQNIQVDASSSTPGVGGSVSSSNRYDSINLVCTVANTTWVTVGAPSGTLTIV